MTVADRPHTRQSVLVAVLLVCAGYAFYNLGDAGTKIVARRLHFSQVLLILSSFNFALMLLYGLTVEGKRAFSTRKPGLVLARALLAQVTTVCNIFAFVHVPLTTFYTLVFTAPLWVAALSAMFMGDKPDARRWGVTLFGFCVVLFVFRPGGGLFNVWTYVVLLSAFAFAAQMLVIRRLGTTESRPFMYMVGGVVSVLIALPFYVSHAQPMTAYEWGLFVMMGVTGAIGQLCVSYGFQTAPSASTVAPYHYTQIVWGALLGYYLFNERPGIEVMLGAALIILSGLYLMHRETKRATLVS